MFAMLLLCVCYVLLAVCYVLLCFAKKPGNRKRLVLTSSGPDPPAGSPERSCFRSNLNSRGVDNRKTFDIMVKIRSPLPSIWVKIGGHVSFKPSPQKKLGKQHVDNYFLQSRWQMFTTIGF